MRRLTVLIVLAIVCMFAGCQGSGAGSEGDTTTTTTPTTTTTDPTTTTPTDPTTPTTTATTPTTTTTTPTTTTTTTDPTTPTPTTTTTTTTTYLKGVAARGAVLPKGSRVEIRGAPSNTKDGSPVSYTFLCSIQNPAWADVTISLTPQTPSALIVSEISDDSGNYQVDVSTLTAPYLIRIADATGHVVAQNNVKSNWYYSIAASADVPANVNPLTDAMVHSWYMYSNWTNLSTVNIDTIFTSGVYATHTSYKYGGMGWSTIKWADGTFHADPHYLPEGMAFPMPKIDEINGAIVALNFWINHAYSTGSQLTDFESPISGKWIIGQGLDAILDIAGSRISEIYIALGCYYQTNPAFIKYGIRVVAFYGYAAPAYVTDKSHDVAIVYLTGGNAVEPGDQYIASYGSLANVAGTNVTVANGYKYTQVNNGWFQGSPNKAFCTIGILMPDGSCGEWMYNLSTTGDTKNDGRFSNPKQ